MSQTNDELLKQINELQNVVKILKEKEQTKNKIEYERIKKNISDALFSTMKIENRFQIIMTKMDYADFWNKITLEYVQNFLLKNKDRLLSLVCPKLKSNDWKVPAHDRSSMGSYRKILTCAKKTGDKSTRRNGCNPVYSLYRHSMA
ncbi:hypothetical protein [Haliscomenobacter hydrossis]|uniref:hypothetical protein n=1 Tax=Haliscomenobacter hydrossis TaxID=2350 RepID=UPI001FE1A829|nr:hypothetical protein [Haliscomenobacter hydrossis]